MPVIPQFIPISKKRQFLTVSSWRRGVADDGDSNTNVQNDSHGNSNNNHNTHSLTTEKDKKVNTSDNKANTSNTKRPIDQTAHEHDYAHSKENQKYNLYVEVESKDYVRSNKLHPREEQQQQEQEEKQNFHNRRRRYSYSHDIQNRKETRETYGPSRGYHSSKLTYKESKYSKNDYPRNTDTVAADDNDDNRRSSNSNYDRKTCNSKSSKNNFHDRRRRKSASKRKERNNAKVDANAELEYDDTLDYYVHVSFPRGVNVKEFEEELCRYICPIKFVDIGPRVNLVDRKSVNNNANNNNTNKKTFADEQKTNKDVKGAETFDIEAFKTPAITAVNNSQHLCFQHNSTWSSDWHNTLSDPLHDENQYEQRNMYISNECDETPGALPPAISLPPAGLSECTQNADQVKSNKSQMREVKLQEETVATTFHGSSSRCANELDKNTEACVVAESSSLLLRESSSEYYISVLYAEREEADAASGFISKHWPSCTLQIVPRDTKLHNCTLVCKNAPNLSTWMKVMTEMSVHNCTPTYYRFLHSEHGSFRGIVFLKYDNREVAESSKMKLEMMSVGGKPLRVEFKRKATESICNNNNNNNNSNGQVNKESSLSKNNVNNSSKQVTILQTSSAASSVTTATTTIVATSECNESNKPIDQRAPILRSTELELTRLIRALRTSTENEGIVFTRNQLTNAELKILKLRCLTYGMHFYMDDKQIRVQRPFGGYNAFVHHNLAITSTNQNKPDAHIQKGQVNNANDGNNINTHVRSEQKSNHTNPDSFYARWSSANARNKAYTEHSHHNESHSSNYSISNNNNNSSSNNSSGRNTSDDYSNKYNRHSPGLHALPNATTSTMSKAATNLSSSSSMRSLSSSSSSSCSSGTSSDSSSTRLQTTASGTSSATSSSTNTPAMKYTESANKQNLSETEEETSDSHHHVHHHHHDDKNKKYTSSRATRAGTLSQSNTPAWAPVTPAPFRPMDFKGIRHWRDIQGHQSQLGIIRPLGPDDGLTAFAAGRGRPV